MVAEWVHGQLQIQVGESHRSQARFPAKETFIGYHIHNGIGYALCFQDYN